MNQSAIRVRMKTTQPFNATLLKFLVLPVHQVNQNPKAMAKGEKGTLQTPKVEEKDDAVSPETKEAKPLKVTEPIHLRVRRELAKAKARKVKAKVLTQKQKQRPTPKVSPSLKEMPVDLL